MCYSLIIQASFDAGIDLDDTSELDQHTVAGRLHYTCMGESFQDFEADFPKKVSLKMLNWRDYNRFSDSYSVCLKTTDHLNLKL